MFYIYSSRIQKQLLPSVNTPQGRVARTDHRCHRRQGQLSGLLLPPPSTSAHWIKIWFLKGQEVTINILCCSGNVKEVTISRGFSQGSYQHGSFLWGTDQAAITPAVLAHCRSASRAKGHKVPVQRNPRLPLQRLSWEAVGQVSSLLSSTHSWSQEFQCRVLEVHALHSVHLRTIHVQYNTTIMLLYEYPPQIYV